MIASVAALAIVQSPTASSALRCIPPMKLPVTAGLPAIAPKSAIPIAPPA